MTMISLFSFLFIFLMLCEIRIDTIVMLSSIYITDKFFQSNRQRAALQLAKFEMDAYDCYFRSPFKIQIKNPIGIDSAAIIIQF